MERIKSSFIRFMQGRYGYDKLNNFIIALSLFFAFINIFVNHIIFVIISYALLIYAIYRMFSRNVWERQKENMHYLEQTKGIRQSWMVFKNNLMDRNHKYFVCPSCHQTVRVPRGKGRIEISCPKCKQKFDRKS